MISIKNVVKKYNTQTQIGPVNLDIKSGLTAIIGPNGAGKSTLLTMVGRLLDMDEGQIIVDDYDISTTPSEELAKTLAILKQENHFVTKLTVRQLVSFGRFPYTKGRINTEDEKIINKYIDFFSLTELENRYLDELSGGQRQRAYVAMILIQETPYILLDEPLNNLDISSSVDIMNLLRRAVDELNKTIVAVLHDINIAACYSDYICCMKDGNIVAYDTTEKIMQADLLTDIYDLDVNIIEYEDRLIAIY